MAAVLLGMAAPAAAAPRVERDVPNARAPRAQAASGRVAWHGGPVLHSTRTHVIFWQPPGLPFDARYIPLVEQFLTNVAAASHSTTNVFGLTGQYRDRGGPAAYVSQFAGAVVDSDALPGNRCHEPPTAPPWSVCLTDDQLQGEIEHVVAGDRLPRGRADVYFLVLPNGFGTCLDASSSSCALGGHKNGYCGYHLATPNGIPYAVIPYNAVTGHCQSSNPRPNNSAADPALSTLAHEDTEIVTDPFGDAWTSGDGEEIADLCLSNFGRRLGGRGGAQWNESIAGGHYWLQALWTNAGRACAPRAAQVRVSLTGPRQVRAGRRASFATRVSAPGRRVVAWLWSLGSRRRRASRVWRRAGRYRVVVRVTDAWGDWGFGVHTVRVVDR